MKLNICRIEKIKCRYFLLQNIFNKTKCFADVRDESGQEYTIHVNLKNRIQFINNLKLITTNRSHIIRTMY